MTAGKNMNESAWQTVGKPTLRVTDGKTSHTF
jgi:hypothetical protein